MSSRPHKKSARRTRSFLPWVFLVVIGSFLGSSLFTQYASSEISSLSDELSDNVAPSIEDLASIRGSALEAELALSNLLGRGQVTPERIGDLEDSLAALRSAVNEYLVLPLSPGEQPVYREVQQSWARFAVVARYTRDLAEAGELERAWQRMTGVQLAAEALVQASMRAIEFNARYGQELADEIDASRRRATLVAGALTALSVLLGLIGAVLLHRESRTRSVLADERTKALQDRAEELEQFAGRVAHDIRGPLGAASLAAQLLEGHKDNEEVARIGDRLERNLARANVITTDLLAFARAAAKPDPGARTSLRDVIADVRADLELEAANADVVLDWEPIPRALVACSEGVYLSLLGNLVRNAIKYMGPSTTRRITVRMTEEGSAVRTEIEDTGPGIPDRHLPLLFEPHFRGDNVTGREGLGLGLPTVRKLAESHGGRVGVASVEGRGSRFWFLLPRAGTLSELQPTEETTRDSWHD